MNKLKRYTLTDEQWNKIKSYFEKKKGRPFKNLRATINGIIWILKTVAMWRDLPSRYGDWMRYTNVLVSGKHKAYLRKS